MFTTKPDYIRSNDKHSFSFFTIKTRFPRILQNIIEDNAGIYPAHCFDEMISGLFNQVVSPIHSSDTELFDRSIEPFSLESIFDAPFFVTEMFFYQQIMSVLRLHDVNSDPFFITKKKALTEAFAFMERLAADLAVTSHVGTPVDNISKALLLSLWGNLADLSLFNLHHAAGHINSMGKEHADNILIDDSDVFSNTLTQHTGDIHLFLDNAGYELISDLFLIAVLLKHTACNIVVHVKPIPMFVSDVTKVDWEDTLSVFQHSDNSDVRNWEECLAAALSNGRLSVNTHDFWSSCYHFSDEWFEKLGITGDDITISKGDLNYRRFFEDRMWPADTDTARAITVAKYPVLLVRTLKSEIVTGLDAATVSRLNTTEKNWMSNGKFALIQFVK